MSENENERVVQKIFEAYKRRDIDDYISYFADDSIWVLPDGTRLDKNMHAGMRGDFAAFPDTNWYIEHMVSKGNIVVAEWTLIATHKGVFLGIPATNKKVEMQGVSIFQFESGKVKLYKDYWNLGGLEKHLRE